MSQSEPAPIQKASNRTFSLIPTDRIDVMSTRGRGAVQFRENVRSIADVGLYKPILVNAIDFERTGRYMLICGEGRLLAFRELDLELIQAEIVTVDLATAHLMSLGENMTKSKPKTIEYAYALLEMHEKGASIGDLVEITGHPPHYLKSYINLVRRGEERLLKGVEKGIFPLDLAMRVAESPDGAIQHVLMDAYDRKFITAKHVDLVRRILIDRTKHGKELKETASRYATREAYSVDDLKRDIQRITREKEKFVYVMASKETRLLRLDDALKRVRADEAVMEILRRHQLDVMPALEGPYVV